MSCPCTWPRLPANEAPSGPEIKKPRGPSSLDRRLVGGQGAPRGLRCPCPRPLVTQTVGQATSLSTPRLQPFQVLRATWKVSRHTTGWQCQVQGAIIPKPVNQGHLPSRRHFSWTDEWPGFALICVSQKVLEEETRSPRRSGRGASGLVRRLVQGLWAAGFLSLSKGAHSPQQSVQLKTVLSSHPRSHM